MKRQRVQAGSFQAKRPVDKKIITLNYANNGTTQVNTTIFTAAAPCTLNGVLLQYQPSSVSAHTAFAICRVDDGDTSNAVVVATNNNAFYSPEQDVLLYGISSSLNPNVIGLQSSKCKRKLQIGDKIVVSSRADAADPTQQFMIITLFFKY